MLHGITQSYLPPGRGDIPALTSAKAGTRLSDPGGMQGCVDLDVGVVYRYVFGTQVTVRRYMRPFAVHVSRGVVYRYYY